MVKLPCLAAVFAGTQFASIPGASAQTQLWVRQLGMAGSDDAWAAAPDADEGMFVAGGTQSSLGATNQGQQDVVLARFDRLGNQLWIRQFGTELGDAAFAAVSDGAGGVFVGGSIEGNLNGGGDAWVAKYDAAGNQAWLRRFGPGNVWAVAPDGYGGVFAAGRRYGGAPNHDDILLARFDSAGVQAWVHSFGGVYVDEAKTIVGDGIGGFFVAGLTQNNLAAPNTGNDDAWLARWTGSGTQQWIRQLGGNFTDEFAAAVPDGSGGVFLAGYTSSNLTGTAQSGEKRLVARYDADGNRLWLRQYGPGGDFVDNKAAIADGSGGFYTAGRTGTYPLAVFLARYSSAGDRLWTHTFGTPSDDAAYGLAAAGVGAFYVVGSTTGSLGGSAAGQEDMFVALYGAPCYSNCDASTAVPTLNVADFICFMNKYAAGDSYGNCDGSTLAPVLNVNDFVCFSGAYAAGCQ